MAQRKSAGEVLVGVVYPALAAVFRPHEVDAVHLVRVPLGADEEFKLTLTACGEDFSTVAYSTAVAYPPAGAQEVLREQFVDFVAESRFGWGQNRDR